MKKSKKLLSVLLAVVMILSSMSILASAANFDYKTHEGLGPDGLNAYSPYGEVTRLSTDERLGLVFDFLDDTLAGVNFKPINQDLSILGSVYVNINSVNEICKTLDSFKALLGQGFSGFLVGLVGGLLGDIANLSLDSWTSGMSRETSGDAAILQGLLAVLNENVDAIETILNKGSISIGVLANFIDGFDLSSIEAYLKDIPGLIKGLIFPLFERKDDDMTQVNALAKTAGDGGLQTVLNNFVKGLFTKPQSTTTYFEDADGRCISNHTLPTEQGTRYYYEKNGDSFTCYVYDTKTGAYVAEKDVFTKTLEADGSYSYRKANGDALKYYENESYWLSSVKDAIDNGDINIDLNTTSAAQLLYDFIPYVFREMAPVVLNGSVKKLFAELLGADFTYVGDVGSDEVNALSDASDPFFTEEQGDYLWEWTNYAVINGTHYYRYEDQIFQGDTSAVNPFFKLIDWEWNITDDFIDEFIPEVADGTTQSAAGYTTVLQGLNKFLVKAAKEVMDDDFEATLELNDGDNSNLIANIKKVAQAVVKTSPETIFGAEYEDPDKYYSLIMSDNDQEVLIGIACTVIDLVMPQMILPKADTIKGENYTIGAILAALLRELATQLIPNHNYDALIYSDYNNKTFVADKDNNYWLDVILTIGTDIGVYYLKALADMGEDTEAWTNGMPYEDNQTYTAADLDADGGLKVWEARVDYIVDWALEADEEWAWHFERLVDAGADIDLAVPQDPWVKLGNILKSILPLDQILNVNFGDDHWLKTVLKDNFVLAIADLNLKNITDMFIIPTGSVLRQTNLFTQLATVIRNLLNGILKKVAGGDLIPTNITNFDELLTKANIIAIVRSLLTKLPTAYTNGLLDPVLPIANFFIGWSVDPQELADPVLSFNNTDGYGYMFTSDGTTVNTTLNVRNASSGMLLEHRESEIVDHPYTMYITAVKSEYGDVSVEGLPVTVEPGASAQLQLSMPYTGDKATTVTISYYYLFKDGSSPVGDGTAIDTTAYEYVSNLRPQTEEVNTYDTQTVQVRNTLVSSVNAISIKPQDVPKYRVLGNLASLSNLSYTFENVNDQSYSVWISQFSASGAPDYVAVDTSSFVHGTTEIEDMKNASHGWMDGDNTLAAIAPYALDGNKDVSSVVSGSVVDLGTFSVTWHNAKSDGSFGVGNSGNCNVTFNIDAGDVYYKDVAELTDVFEQYEGVQRKNYTADANAEWTAFSSAMLEAEALLAKPFQVSTFASDYAPDNLSTLVEKIRNAYDALALKEATVTDDVLQEALAKAEPGGDVPEINYQNYELYEYFNYEDYRTAVRDRIKEYQGPVAPEKYIPDSSLWGNETVEEFLGTVENAKKKEAITATVIQPTEEEQDAYQQALADFRAPTYSELDNDNQSQLLNFYKQFLIKKDTNKQFLAKEIAYADAQNYNEADYSKDSWKAYQDAYNNATTVNSNGDALQSEVFDAKYALMKAENELLLKEKSAKETGALDELQELIDKAEDIFTNSANYKVKGEMDETEAYKQLIEALGYDTGSEILYDHSALTFTAYDRETTQNNLSRIDAAEAKLQAAIDNFELAAVPDIFAKEDDDEGTTPGQSHTGVVDTENNDGVHMGGYLYGIEVGEKVEEVFGSHASLKFVANDKGVTNGTGAVVQVMNGEDVYAEYVVIIFGDVDGDGRVNSSDSAMIKQGISSGSSQLSNVQEFAGDVNADGHDDSSDSSAILQSVANPDSPLTTNPYAV